MKKRFVVCQVDENYLKTVKEQMKKQNMPVPKEDANITISHRPAATIYSADLCSCKVCERIKKSVKS